MPTFVDGQQNLSALQVPGVYLGIVTPRPFMNGVPTNMVGIVGAASWGPVNAPFAFSGPDTCATVYGTPQARKYDLPTFVWVAALMGSAIGFYGVRVTDGTDVAATGAVQANCLNLTAKYSGTLGNSIKFQLSVGSAPNSYMAIVSMPGRQPEQFNNITGSGATLWANVAAAINNGNATRNASDIIVATVGAGTAAPTLGAPVTLSGGTDGSTGVTDTTLLGSDAAPRTGMYALRHTQIDGFALCDHTTSSHWPTIDAYALSENALACQVAASGQTIAQVKAAKIAAGLDSPWTWLSGGDYPTFFDTVNGYARMVSPAAYMLGWIGNASPEQSPLNKQLSGINATQKSLAQQTYSDAELADAVMAGIEVIVGPPVTPGGNYFTFIVGRNASSNTAANGVEWTRVTNFIARSLQNKAAGAIVGRLQSNRPNDRAREDAKSLVDGFFGYLKDPAVGSYGNGIIEDFATICDQSNNPLPTQMRGYLFLYAAVKYLNVVRYFVVKLAAGGSVSVTSESTASEIARYF